MNAARAGHSVHVSGGSVQRRAERGLSQKQAGGHSTAMSQLSAAGDMGRRVGSPAVDPADWSGSPGALLLLLPTPSLQPGGQGQPRTERNTRVSRGPSVTREGPGAGESPGKARRGADRRGEEAERAARGGSADLEMDLNVDGNSRAAVRSTTRETHNEGRNQTLSVNTAQ